MLDFIDLADGRIDLQRRVVRRGGVDTALTAREAELLAYLAVRPGQAIDRAALLVDVWGYHPDARTRAIDATVRRLRTKIERDPGHPALLLTVHGEGYAFAPPVTGDDDLIGRAALRQQLAGLGRGVHMLLGPGGIGKTRLAHAWRPDLFIDLSAVDDLAGVLQACAVALDVPLGGRTDADGLAQLGFAWAARAPLRVVLDNAEQARSAVAACVEAWVDGPHTWLVTSREALGVVDEAVIEVPPLAPTDAARLFARRIERDAAAADPGAVADLVARLDHLPLAIELAAARSAILDAEQMLQRLDRSAALLRAADPERPERHRSIQAALEWSWQLLTPAAQTGLRALSVFRGGFELAAAEAVLGEDAIDALDELAAKQLVVRRGPRFHLLETVRRFAHDRLGALDAPARAARYVVERAEADPTCVGAEVANLRAALASAPLPWSIRAGLALLPWLYRRGPRSLHASITETVAAQALAHDDPRLRLRALHARADLRRAGGRFDAARADVQAALRIAERLDDGPWIARLLGRAGDVERYHKQYATARRAFEAAEAQLTATPDPRVRAEVLKAHAAFLFDQGAFDAAEGRYIEAIALLRAAGDLEEEAVLLGNLGNVCLDAGHDDRARPLYDRALELHRRLGDRRFEGIVGANRALLLHLAGDLDAAQAQAQAALALHRVVGNRRFVGFARYLLAGIAHERGDLSEALDHLGACLEIWQAIGERMFFGFAQCRVALAEAERGALQLARHALADGERRLEGRGSAGFAVHAAGVDLCDPARTVGPIDAPATSFGRVGRRIFLAMKQRKEAP